MCVACQINPSPGIVTLTEPPGEERVLLVSAKDHWFVCFFSPLRWNTDSCQEKV